MKFAGCVPVVEAEMVGILEAIAWISHVQASSVMIESDSQLCVQALKGENNNFLELGNLILHGQALISSRSGLFCF